MPRDDLSTLLRDAAPASTDEADVQALWARGRRLRAWRRIGQGVAVLAAVAVLGTGAALLAGRPVPTLIFGEESGEHAAVPAEPAPRFTGVDYQRVAEVSADGERWAVLAQRSAMLAGLDVLVEGDDDGASAILPLPDDGLSASVQAPGRSVWVMALVAQPAVAARARSAGGETTRAEAFDTGFGARLAVLRMPVEESGEDRVDVVSVEALDADGEVLARESGDALEFQGIGLPLESQYEHVANGEYAGDGWTLDVIIDGYHMPAEWTAVQPRLTFERKWSTHEMSWQVGAHPEAPFRPQLFDGDYGLLLVSGWAPDEARLVRIHHADGEVTEAPVHQPPESPFAFYVVPAPGDDEHPTAGIELVEAVDGDGEPLERWESPAHD